MAIEISALLILNSNVTLWTVVIRGSVMTVKWSRRRIADMVIE